MTNGLNITGRLDKYSGKRYTEFVFTVIDNALNITQKLVKKKFNTDWQVI